MKSRAFREPDIRRLKLNYIHHPRSYRHSPQEWELHRGFRIRVLTSHALAMFIGKPSEESDLLSRLPESTEDSFLVIPAPHGPPAGALKEALAVCAEEGWSPDVVLVMSDERLLDRAMAAGHRLLKSEVPRSHPGLVIWVWQEMPAELCGGFDFFNAEQILHQFGRMGRRVGRRVRWRKFLP